MTARIFQSTAIEGRRRQSQRPKYLQGVWMVSEQRDGAVLLTPMKFIPKGRAVFPPVSQPACSGQGHPETLPAAPFASMGTGIS